MPISRGIFLKVEGGFFELQASGGQWNFPLDVRLTSYDGEVAKDRVTDDCTARILLGFNLVSYRCIMRLRGLYPTAVVSSVWSF